MKIRLAGYALLVLNVSLIAIGVVLLVSGLKSEVAQVLWVFTVLMNAVMIVPNAKLALGD